MPEPGLIDAMKAAAKISGCVVEEAFTQMAHVNVATWTLHSDVGICTGLSAMWLDMLRKGEGDKFRESVTGAGVKPARDTSHAWWAAQRDKPWVKDDGLEDAEKSNLFTIEITRGSLVEGRPNPGLTDRFTVTLNETGKLVDWVNKTRMGKRRFFLVHCHGHTMAAAKNRKGRLRFYDPNGGVVGTWFASNLKEFLILYLTTEKAFRAYAEPVQKHKMELTAEKYRPTDW
jgi:hypothetical protein